MINNPPTVVVSCRILVVEAQKLLGLARKHRTSKARMIAKHLRKALGIRWPPSWYKESEAPAKDRCPWRSGPRRVKWMRADAQRKKAKFNSRAYKNRVARIEALKRKHRIGV